MSALPNFSGKVYLRDDSIDYKAHAYQYAYTSEPEGTMAPAAIVYVADDEDIKLAIEYARANNLGSVRDCPWPTQMKTSPAFTSFAQARRNSSNAFSNSSRVGSITTVIVCNAADHERMASSIHGNRLPTLQGGAGDSETLTPLGMKRTKQVYKMKKLKVKKPKNPRACKHIQAQGQIKQRFLKLNQFNPAYSVARLKSYGTIWNKTKATECSLAFQADDGCRSTHSLQAYAKNDLPH